jgi:hypothetical protein
VPLNERVAVPGLLACRHSSPDEVSFAVCVENRRCATCSTARCFACRIGCIGGIINTDDIDMLLLLLLLLQLRCCIAPPTLPSANGDDSGFADLAACCAPAALLLDSAGFVARKKEPSVVPFFTSARCTRFEWSIYIIASYGLCCKQEWVWCTLCELLPGESVVPSALISARL